MAEEPFDFAAFALGIQAVSPEDRQARVKDEMARVNSLVVRDPSKRFEQHLYLKRLQRLSRFLAGEDVTGELTPSEARSYALLSGAPPPVEAQLAVPEEPAPPPPAPAPAPVVTEPKKEPEGKERRVARRIAMKTKVRVRRDNVDDFEIVEPLNVSRGGVGFESVNEYQLDEIIWVIVHYEEEKPDSEQIETRSTIVRVVPLKKWDAFSYGVQFTPA